MPDDLPEPEEVLAIHDEIEQEYDLTYTGAAVAAPRLSIQQLLEEVAEYEDVYYRAAALLRDLITSHLFEEGNKRTAWATTVLYLQDHDEAPAAADDLAHVEHVLKRIRRFDVDEIAGWLQTGDIDEERLSP